METSAKIFRKDGHWVIKLEVEQWIIDDILYDTNSRDVDEPVTMDIVASRESTGGTTRYWGDVLPLEPKPIDSISAYVTFRPTSELDTDEE